MLYCKKSAQHFTTIGGWYPCEETALRGMVQDNYGMRHMCQVLSRSYESVHKKISILGLRKC